MAQDNIDCNPSTPNNAFVLAERERAIYLEYLEEIVPLIASIEVYDNEFPVEILNEVRSIFTHFARCKVSADEGVIESDMAKAERHLKRLRFDCCKYIAAMHSESVGDFLAHYSPKVLAGVDNGQFHIRVNRMMLKADGMVIEAKRLETGGDEDAALSMYDAAAKVYAELQEYIDQSSEALAHAQTLYGAFEERVEKNGEESNKLTKVGITFSIISFFLGALVSFLLTVLL